MAERPTKERRPTLPGWSFVPWTLPPPPKSVLAISAWQSGTTCVISALELANLPDGSGVGPQWHVSITRLGKRPKDHDLRRALRAFGMVGTEEDNHHPGNARHFWLPLDPARRVDCECKEDEQVVTDPDGYQWTNPKDGACRGCEFARSTGIRSCPLHMEASR